jgi:hypothetical protein
MTSRRISGTYTTGRSLSAGKVEIASTRAFTSFISSRGSLRDSTSTTTVPQAFDGRGAEPLDPFQVLDGFLDLDRDAFLDLRRRGAGERHPHRDRAQLEGREDLQRDLRGQRPGAEAEQGDHQQVRRHVVAREPGDHALHCAAPSAATRSDCGPRRGAGATPSMVAATSVPPAATASGVMLTTSPASSPAVTTACSPSVHATVTGRRCRRLSSSTSSTSAAVAQRAAREHERVFQGPADDLDLHELADPERRLAVRGGLVGVIHLRDDEQLARAGVNRALGAHDAAGPAPFLATDRRLDDDLRAGGAALRGLAAEAFRQVHELELAAGQRQSYLDVVRRIDPREQGAGRDELPDVHVLFQHLAIVGCADPGPLEVEARPLELRPGGQHGGARRRDLRLAQAELRRLAPEHAPVALDHLGLGQLLLERRLGLGHLRLGAGDGQLVVARVEGHQHVAFLEEAALAERWRDGDDLPGHLRNQGALGARLHGPLAPDDDPVILGHCADRVDGDRHLGRVELRRRRTLRDDVSASSKRGQQHEHGKSPLEELVEHLGLLKKGSVDRAVRDCNRAVA